MHLLKRNGAMNKDEAHRRMAGALLTKAATTVLKDRGDRHGGAENSFAMIGELWSVYIRHTTQHRTSGGADADVVPIQYVKVSPSDVAQMMVMLKISRSVYGNPMEQDHFVDEIGYSSLAGALATAEYGAKTQTKDDSSGVGLTDEELSIALKGTL